MQPVSRTPRATILSGWLLHRLGHRPLLTRLLAETYSLDGRSRSFRTTIIPLDTRTSIAAGTSISLRTVLSPFPGGFAREVATPFTTFSLVMPNRTCKIGNQILIGSKSRIADNAQIVASVLGQRCVIGAGSIVRNSYLFDGVVIGPNCVVEYSIIGAGVQIKEASRVERGCLIADKVTIGPKARLEPFRKLLRKSQDDHDQDEGEEEEEADEDEDEDEDDEADDEEDEDEDNEEEDESEEEEDSDYEEVEASKYGSTNVYLLLMSCFRSGSRCARKTWVGIQCDYMARAKVRRGRRYR